MLRTWDAPHTTFFFVMAGHSPSKTGVNALMSRPSKCLPGTSPGMTSSASLRRHRHCGRDGADFVAAVDDLARLVRLDDTGVERLEHRLLTVDNHREFAR